MVEKYVVCNETEKSVVPPYNECNSVKDTEETTSEVCPICKGFGRCVPNGIGNTRMRECWRCHGKGRIIF